MLRGELIRECQGAQQRHVAPAPRGGAGPGDPALKHPMAIGTKHPQQRIGVTAASGAPDRELGACLHTFPLEEMLLGSSSFAARSSCFPGRTRAWKSLPRWENNI